MARFCLHAAWAVCAMACFSGPVTVEDEWLGRMMFLKPDAMTMNGTKRVPRDQVPFPAIVDDVDGEWLLMGPAWVRKRDVMTPSEALKFFTARIEAQPNDARSYGQRGSVWFAMKRPDEAVRDHTEALRINPGYVPSYYNRALAREKLGDFAGAQRDFQEVLRREQKRALVYRAYARFLVRCPDEQFRDGLLAVEMATKGCELMDWQEPIYLDTLAAAYSEAGDFEKAIEWQSKAIERMQHYNDEGRLARMKEILVLFKAHRPYREGPPEGWPSVE